VTALDWSHRFPRIFAESTCRNIRTSRRSQRIRGLSSSDLTSRTLSCPDSTAVLRILFLTHRLPYAPNRGDRIRAYHLVRTLAQRATLDVVSLVHDDMELAQVGAVEALGARVAAVRTSPVRGYAAAAVTLAGSRPVTHALLDGPAMNQTLRRVLDAHPPDVVLAFCSGMARFAFEPPLRGIPTVVDFVDIDSEKWAALAASSPWPKSWIYGRESRTLGAFEAEAATRAAHSLVVTDREIDVVRRIAPAAHAHVIYNGVALDHLRPTAPPATAQRVVFCGVMNYEPNVDGVRWFAREVWPRVRTRTPDATFIVVGAQPTDEIRALQNGATGIEVTGTVEDVRPYLWNGAISVAPLQTARGLQNKVLEALAAGLPAVVTPQVMEGLPDVARAGCASAASPEQFAAAVTSLLERSPDERRAIASAAQLDGLSWDQQLSPVYALLEDAVSRCSGSLDRRRPV
jgi:sugar transferase (PEP-CTERM/EpsH1 system associated)